MPKQTYSLKRTYIGKLVKGTDLLNGITGHITANKIQAGEIRGLGAVSRAVVWYYDQVKKKYEEIVFDRHMEILSLYGNVSIRDDEPFAHCHITLSDEKGQAFGGHLAEGTIVFASEIMIHEFDGEKIVREFDEETGLYLWNYQRELLL
jgi:uncharacterized protein